jgi:hypothetical protein
MFFFGNYEIMEFMFFLEIMKLWNLCFFGNYEIMKFMFFGNYEILIFFGNYENLIFFQKL